MKSILKKFYYLSDGKKCFLFVVFALILFFFNGQYLYSTNIYLQKIISDLWIMVPYFTSIFFRIMFLVFLKDEVMQNENKDDKDIKKAIKINILISIFVIIIYFIVKIIIRPTRRPTNVYY